jgi:hypothetical protein
MFASVGAPAAANAAWLTTTRRSARNIFRLLVTAGAAPAPAQVKQGIMDRLIAQDPMIITASTRDVTHTANTARRSPAKSCTSRTAGNHAGTTVAPEYQEFR